MIMDKRLLLLPALALSLQGCVVGKVAGAAVDVATAPVKAAGYAADKLTTSQAEADRNYGKKYRKAEEEYGKQLKAWNRECAKLREQARECPPQPEFVAPDY